MNGTAGLANTIKSALQKKVDTEARALHGKVRDGQFQCGAKSYPIVQAVDVDCSEGKKVWAQLSQNGSAVVVGN